MNNWYSKVGGEPGFTKESLAALKQKAEFSKSLLATLVLDEMKWDERNFHGYVDMDTEIEGGHLAEAKEALVFLVTAVNTSCQKFVKKYFIL